MTSTQTVTLEDIDLLEDTWAQGVPHDQFDLLRREAPVFWHEHPAAEGFWVITKHADVKAISHDVKTFSTELGSAFILDQDPMAMEFHRMTLLQMDPPKHNRYRRLVSAGFTPRMITMLIDSIDEQAKRIVGNVEGRDEIEFTMDIAAELPMQAICEMIGIPEEDRHRVTALANRMVGAQDPDFQSSEEDGNMAAAEMYAVCDEIAADRRVNPRDDIMSILVNAEVDGDRLTETELNLFFVLLVVAGNETTRNLIAHAMLALDRQPRRARRARGRHRRRRAVGLRRRGDAPVGRVDPQLPAHGHARRRGAGRADQGRAEGRDVLRVGEPRRRGVRRSAPLRHPPLAERPRDVRRRRRALLPRRQPRPPRDQVDAARVPAPLSQSIARGRTSPPCAPISSTASSTSRSRWAERTSPCRPNWPSNSASSSRSSPSRIAATSSPRCRRPAASACSARWASRPEQLEVELAWIDEHVGDQRTASTS